MSRFIRKDFDQLYIAKKGVRPQQLLITIESYLDDFKTGTKQRKDLKNIVDELREATYSNNFAGQSHTEHIGYVSDSGELTAMFIAYQYRMMSMFYAIN